jgi:hypothetical protein
MSEAADRQEMERRLVQWSLEDESYRKGLLADPKAAVEQDLGTRMPAGVRVVAVEESADTVYLVLPPRSKKVQDAGELSDRELEAVAGGWEQASHSERYPTDGGCGC